MSNNTAGKAAPKATHKEAPATDLNVELEAAIQSAAGKSQAKIFDAEAHKRNLQNAQEALMDEFQTLMADTERLFNHTKEAASTQTEELRESIEHNLNRARDILQERHQHWTEQSNELKERAEAYVHEKPWQSLGMAAGAGLLLGLILRR